jgi:hypothetical protein
MPAQNPHCQAGFLFWLHKNNTKSRHQKGKLVPTYLRSFARSRRPPPLCSNMR